LRIINQTEDEAGAIAATVASRLDPFFFTDR
jgi:hypothetical protein